MKDDHTGVLLPFYKSSNDWAVVLDLTDFCIDITRNELMRRVLCHMDIYELMGFMIVDIHRYDPDAVFNALWEKAGYLFSNEELRALSDLFDDMKETLETIIYEQLPSKRKPEHYSLHAWHAGDQVVVGSVTTVYREFESEHWSTKLQEDAGSS